MLLFFGISATASFSKCEEHSRLGKSDMVIKKPVQSLCWLGMF